MTPFRKKPVVIDATRWFKNGDHPDDYTEDRTWVEDGVVSMKPGAYFREHAYEGAIVRYFRRPDVDGETICRQCGLTMHEHGWIETLEGGHITCPGDWVVTGVQGEHYPVKPAIFDATYEAVN